MDLAALFARLEAQRCLATEDQDALVAYADTLYDGEDVVWCDAIWRVASADGVSFDGEPELVRAHASVADVAIEPDGAHILVFNDLAPGLFAETLRDAPARFWERGLVGLGGIALAVDGGAGFVDMSIDLTLPTLALVVDPDIARAPDGTWRLATFQVEVEALDGSSWDPAATAGPHAFHVARSTDYDAFPTSTVAIASALGARGGADPTVLDADGEEILFAADAAAPVAGWSAPGGTRWDPGAAPDVHPPVFGMSPEAVVDPEGGYRLFAKSLASDGISLATSADGHEWTLRGTVGEVLGEVRNPSVAQAPDGTWWLYFGRMDDACVEAAHGG